MRKSIVIALLAALCAVGSAAAKGPHGIRYSFLGTVTATPSNGGNHRAMQLMIGANSTETFSTGDGTIFLLWVGKVPSVIDASKLVVGDRIVVRIRAAAKSSLAQVEATAANHVGDREPASK